MVVILAIVQPIMSVEATCSQQLLTFITLEALDVEVVILQADSLTLATFLAGSTDYFAHSAERLLQYVSRMPSYIQQLSAIRL